MSNPIATSAPDPRVIVVSGGTSGMGRALALARAARGDRVVAIGSNPGKGKLLLSEAERLGASDRIEFICTDLSGISQARAAIAEITARHPVVDALCLATNRLAPQRMATPEGLEQTFAVYYLSRHLLSHGLAPLLRRSPTPVIVSVAAVGITKGSIHWDDLQLEQNYSSITAQLQAGRATDLLGVSFAAQPDNPIRYVLYHPGFTRSGDLTPLPAMTRWLIRAAAALASRSVERSIAPIHGFIDAPPAAPLTAIDRGKRLPLTLATLDPANAARLDEATRALLADLSGTSTP